MQVSGVIHLREGLQRYLEALAVIEHGPMMVRNAPGTWIQIQSLGELHVLGETAQLRIGVAAIQRPVAAAGPIVVFEDVNLIAGVAQLECGRHTGHARAQNQHRRTFRITFEFDGPGINGLARMAQFGHRLVHDCAAGACPDQFEERAPIHGRRRFSSQSCTFLRGYRVVSASDHKSLHTRLRMRMWNSGMGLRTLADYPNVVLPGSPPRNSAIAAPSSGLATALM